MEKKIIICNPSDYRILFLLAAAIKAGYQPSYGRQLESLWEAEEIIFLNIDPKVEPEKFGLHPDLDIFVQFKAANIKAWLQYPGEFDSCNDSVQNILKHFPAQTNIDSLDLNNPNKWERNVYTARYGKALYASKVVCLNKGDMTQHQALLIDVAHSLAEKENNLDIDTMLIQYQRVLVTTEHCFNKISKKQDLINLPGKEIAFGYLDNVSNYLDFSALRKKCLNDYPYLTIIQYRQEGKEYTWLLSRQLNIKKVFQLPKTESDYEILIEYSHKKMLKHLQKLIEGISKI